VEFCTKVGYSSGIWGETSAYTAEA
jgi:hypothetical protein